MWRYFLPYPPRGSTFIIISETLHYPPLSCSTHPGVNSITPCRVNLNHDIVNEVPSLLEGLFLSAPPPGANAPESRGGGARLGQASAAGPLRKGAASPLRPVHSVHRPGGGRGEEEGGGGEEEGACEQAHQGGVQAADGRPRQLHQRGREARAEAAAGEPAAARKGAGANPSIRTSSGVLSASLPLLAQEDP
eukprot:1185973-Prorocentrum_minimum.AAC.1